ncbi:unnamed protein product [Zymoseptoria tritici ST99CH_1A5]|uniref:Peptidase M3A/M3B catalytic domain-containing protein n=3 Tax=Zymoseptoria tritici TaxID=1047171 RepID=A0A1X7RUS4_ZYMT9|nr:unnamed protein product [Zymoseptoria tritici ST99CH_3D7]SMY24770.1 unnamed protein product [Zymoseptoria tritici ST99CH_1A5]
MKFFLLLTAIFELAYRAEAQSYGSFASGNRRPPQDVYVFNDTVASIEQLAAANADLYNTTVQLIIDTVGDPSNATFTNVILPFSVAYGDVDAHWNPVSGYGLSDKEDLADAYEAGTAKLVAALKAVFVNDAFFKLVDSVYKADQTNLDEEDRIILQWTWSQFATSGLNIPAGAQRDEFTANNARIDELFDYWTGNQSEPAYVYFAAEELEGVPATILSELDKDSSGKYQLDASNIDDILAISNNAVNETTRYTMFIAADNTAPGNVYVLEEMTQLRFQVAQALGYASWAEYVLARAPAAVAGTPAAVTDFLEQIGTAAAPLAAGEQARLSAYKSNDTNVISPIGEKDVVYRWDTLFYSQIWKETEYQIDDEAVSAYLPFNVTYAGILKIYEEIYGLTIQRIEGADLDEFSPTGKGSDLLWHPDVMLFAVWDSQDFISKHPDPEYGFRGFILVDPFFRKGKSTGSTYISTLSPSYLKADGCRNYPVFGIVYNFVQSEDEVKPSLLRYRDLNNAFHELGHSMAGLTSINKYEKTNGLDGSPTDYVEFPSQMMGENFIKVPEVLKSISTHWSSFSPQAAAAWQAEQNSTTAALPPVTLPDDLIEGLIKSTSLFPRTRPSGQDVEGRVARFSYDQAIYNQTSLDAVKAIDQGSLYETLIKRYSGVPDPSDIGQPADWGHGETSIYQYGADNYAAQYYSYLFCQIFAEDVFYTKFAADPLNPDIGYDYRLRVLQPGASTNLTQLLTNYLGREPNQNGYYQFIGLGPALGN